MVSVDSSKETDEEQEIRNKVHRGHITPSACSFPRLYTVLCFVVYVPEADSSSDDEPRAPRTADTQ